MTDQLERLARKSMTQKAWIITSRAIEKVLGTDMANRLGRKQMRYGDYHWRVYYSKTTAKTKNKYLMHVDHVVNYFHGRRGRLLDVGCGDGLILAKLTNETSLNCYGIDISPVAIELARFHGLTNCESIDLIDYKLDKKSRFDFIYAGDILEHVANPAIALARMRTWLKYQGTILITIPMQKKAHLGDQRVFTYKSALELISNEFHVIHSDKKIEYLKIYFTGISKELQEKNGTYTSQRSQAQVS